jgi:hypothetical protein
VSDSFISIESNIINCRWSNFEKSLL